MRVQVIYPVEFRLGQDNLKLHSWLIFCSFANRILFAKLFKRIIPNTFAYTDQIPALVRTGTARNAIQQVQERTYGVETLKRSKMEAIRPPQAPKFCIDE